MKARLPVDRVRKMAEGVLMAVADWFVEGNSVIVVGRAPPRLKVVWWSRSWPWRDLGSVFC